MRSDGASPDLIFPLVHAELDVDPSQIRPRIFKNQRPLKNRKEDMCDNQRMSKLSFAKTGVLHELLSHTGFLTILRGQYRGIPRRECSGNPPVVRGCSWAARWHQNACLRLHGCGVSGLGQHPASSLSLSPDNIPCWWFLYHWGYSNGCFSCCAWAWWWCNVFLSSARWIQGYPVSLKHHRFCRIFYPVHAWSCTDW